jgi:anti-sigma regulatory factor (Ser/Thr protein kinase)
VNEGRFSFPPAQQALRKLRADVRLAAARLGAAPAVCDMVALVVDELVNNAIEHGAAYRRRGLELSVRIGVEGGRLSVEFCDPEMPDATVRQLASALADAGNGMPSLENERGRGLFLLSVYLEDLRAEVVAGGGMRLHGLVARN